MKRVWMVCALLFPLSSWSVSPVLEVVIVRGLTRGAEHTRTFLDLLRTRHPDWRVENFDIRGTGQYFDQTSFLSMSENREDLRERWNQSPKVRKRVLMGISLGGMIVLDWLRSHPEDFPKYVVVNSSEASSCPLMERLLPGSYRYVLTTALHPSTRAKERAIRDMTLNLNHSESLIDHWSGLRERQPVSIPNSIRQFWSAIRFSFLPPTQPVSMVVLSSEHDRMVSPHCSRRLAEKMGAETWVHSTAGHDIGNDDPEWLVQKLEAIADSIP